MTPSSSCSWTMSTSTVCPTPLVVAYPSFTLMHAVVHWPVAFPPVPSGSSVLEPEDPNKAGWVTLDLETSLVDTWKAMIALLSTGKVKAIGVSNFSIPHIQGVVDATGVRPVTCFVPRVWYTH